MAPPIYQYFKKQVEADKILVRINPSTFEGTELLVAATGQIAVHNRQFDNTIYEDLDFDDFEKANAIEFNLHLASVSK